MATCPMNCGKIRCTLFPLVPEHYNRHVASLQHVRCGCTTSLYLVELFCDATRRGFETSASLKLNTIIVCSTPSRQRWWWYHNNNNIINNNHVTHCGFCAQLTLLCKSFSKVVCRGGREAIVMWRTRRQALLTVRSWPHIAWWGSSVGRVDARWVVWRWVVYQLHTLTVGPSIASGHMLNWGRVKTHTMQHELGSPGQLMISVDDIKYRKGHDLMAKHSNHSDGYRLHSNHRDETIWVTRSHRMRCPYHFCSSTQLAFNQSIKNTLLLLLQSIYCKHHST